jgi:hypothetical protein
MRRIPSPSLESNMFYRALIASGLLSLACAAGAEDFRAAPPSPTDAVQVAQAAPQREIRPSASTSGRLAVRGPEIVDPSGRPILLRGWNWGHFGKAIEQDAADNAAQGANVVRLPIRWWGFYQGEGIDGRNDSATATAGLDPRNLQIVDDNVRWATRQHLWVILFIDSNCGQNGTQNQRMVDYCDPGHKYPAGHNFWTDPEARARFINLWRFIAARYKDTPYIGLYEPLPEPGNSNVSGEQIAQFYGEVMAAIRQVAPGIPFLIGGSRYRAPQIRQVYNPAWKDVVYTGNLFLHENGGKETGMGSIRERAQDLLDLRAKAGVPVFVQQAGVKAGEDPDQSQLKQLLNVLVDNRIGFAYWEYRGAKSPDNYGVLFGGGKHGGGWQVNQPVMSAISAAFKRPEPGR